MVATPMPTEERRDFDARVKEEEETAGAASKMAGIRWWRDPCAVVVIGTLIVLLVAALAGLLER